MAEQGLHIIRGLRRRWMLWQLAADVLLSVAAALVIGAMLLVLNISVTWSVLAFVILLAGLLLIDRSWRVTDRQVASYLNKTYPELQESVQLILLPEDDSNFLKTLAVGQAQQALATITISDRYFAKRAWSALGVLVLACAIVFLIVNLHKQSSAPTSSELPAAFASPTKPEKVLPQIDRVLIKIIPPAYTRRGPREQDKFNLIVEDGAIVNWHISTNIAIKNAYLLFNGKERISLKGKYETQWESAKMITASGFYQVIIDGRQSDLYQLQVVKDAPPVVHIKSPRQYTYIDAGEAQKVNIHASLTDDYGIAASQIVATVAKGRGEGVKFKEYRLNFAADMSGQNPAYDLQKVISLPSLNMEPGDELYFYIQATDTRSQQTRSDVYTVTLQDTAELLSMNGMLTGSSIKPEFFRSERQIIIDAERLIKDKDSITVEKFNARSNDLGIDQKLLRLRYGKFLGEEGEDNIGKPDDSPANPADFSNAAKILKEYTDDHDNAEDAGFFEPGTKAQLKATLNEMWKAELQLRLYKPQSALPFAYKALRLLKDLQQKSRSYVAKTSYNSPPLKPEKRLSGELDKIIQPTNRAASKPAADNLIALKNAIPVLEKLKHQPLLTPVEMRALQLASQQLVLQASAQPGSYLPALNAMHRILSAQKTNPADVNLVERAIQRALTQLKPLPASTQTAPDMGLGKQYYKNLKPITP